ncbi:hypothetical protein [Crocinitomix catalasitica]|uniref:hypothetical protein n=1 Tax=Crocinitomix catalasitica TaxID=184607 RepID=UPI000487477B|nr:hypothetical protein [Crocinitomix catalasitica]
MKVFRIFFIALATAVFCFLGYYLYQKQYNQYSLLSFQLNDKAVNVILTDIDKLSAKVDQFSDLDISEIPVAVEQHLDAILARKSGAIRDIFGRTILLSYDATDFVLAFHNNELNESAALAVLGIEAKSKEEGFFLNGKRYYVNKYGNYFVLSSTKINPLPSKIEAYGGNADYVVYADSTIKSKHILANKSHFTIWNAKAETVRGKAVIPTEFIAKLPAEFDTVTFYGSSRLYDDKYTFFKNPDEDFLNWAANGVLVLKKGSFEILLAPQNDQRDLRLILEEETLNNQSDSSNLKKIKMKGYTIMPFQSSNNWQSTIPDVHEQLNYFTAVENFNVLSNSLEAINWYLAELQTGNFVSYGDPISNKIRSSMPEAVHYFQFINNKETEDMKIATKIWKEKWLCTHTETVLIGSEKSASDNANLALDLEFVTTGVIELNKKEKKQILVYSKNQLACVDPVKGVVWTHKLKSSLKQKPAVVDIDKDGNSEILLFHEEHLNLLSIDGDVKQGFPIQLGGKSNGGVALNYDLAYDYRFLITVGNSVKMFNENGQIVLGWEFNSTNNLAFQSNMTYLQLKGKDYIGLSESSGMYYVLNRKGQNRFQQNHQFNFKSASDFIAGENEDDLHKLGYANQYIYNYYLKTGIVDSIKVDRQLTPIELRWKKINNKPFLLADEPNRIFIIDQFGYIETEILKPQGATKFLDIHSNQFLVFYDMNKELLYILNRSGKIIAKSTVDSENAFSISENQLYVITNDKLKIINL